MTRPRSFFTATENSIVVDDNVISPELWALLENKIIHIAKEFDAKPSPVHGFGLFTKKSYKKGDVVYFFLQKVMKEQDYIQLFPQHSFLERMGARYIDDNIFFDTEIQSIDYINHSETPNLLYHCGVFFARQPIEAGEELFADYRYVLTESESLITNEGALIKGLPARQALFLSTAALLQILSDVENGN